MVDEVDKREEFGPKFVDISKISRICAPPFSGVWKEWLDFVRFLCLNGEVCLRDEGRNARVALWWNLSRLETSSNFVSHR